MTLPGASDFAILRGQAATVAGGVILLVGVILVERAPASPSAATSADAA
jgi:hypothetical protein